MKYLIAVDASEDSKKAFDYGLQLFTPDDFVVLLSVIEPISMIDEVNLEDRMIREYKHQLEENAAGVLGRYGKMLTDANILHETVMRRGTAKDVICSEIEKRNVDLLLIGRRGLSNVKRIFVGSNSEYCVQNAHCSVLVIKN